MPKKTPTDPQDIQSITYEQAFEELEKILGQLESEHSSLEETLALFERGRDLVQRCTVLLEEADLRLHILTDSPEEPLTDEDFS